MRAWPWIIAWGLPLLANGCATNALWNKAPLDAWNEPASNPNLCLFDVSRRKDFLVVYDEYSERHDSVHPRAYFLYHNQKRVTQGQKPRFVNTRLSRELPPVPIFQNPPEPSTNSPPTIYAVVSADKQSFAIYSGQGKTAFSLAVYNDGRGQIYRIALTPIAVTADITVVGGVLALFCWDVLAKSNSSFNGP
jgi:hypothetical protein